MAIASAVATARDLVSRRPAICIRRVRQQAKLLGTAAGLTVEGARREALAKAGYGGIVGVGRDRRIPPRLGAADPPRRQRKKVAEWPGRAQGITFDTGGISIKPAARCIAHDLRAWAGRPR